MKKNEIEIKKRNQDINKRTEIEKELNIQRNGKNRKKGLNAYDIKMNHLNYYNEIAKNNIYNLMNNPTLKEIERITSNESVFDQLKAKEQSKDLSKFLDNLPLKRVERINYKGKEIGKMRKSLGVYCQDNPYVFIDKERAGKFASHLFEKRKREASANYKPVESIDNLYKKDLSKKRSDTFNFKNLTTSNNESWIQKYKRNGNSKNRVPSKQNSRFNTEVSNNNIENKKFEKNKIEVNKNKSNYKLDKGKEKINEYLNKNVIQTNGNEIGRSFTKNERNINLNINTFHISNKRDNNRSNNNIYRNSNYNNGNNSTNNGFPKRTLTMNYSENKVKLDSRNIQSNYSKDNHKELSFGAKRTLSNNIKINSTSNIYGKNNITKKKEENENRINVRIRRRNENNNNNNNNDRTNITVKKNEELVKRNDNRGYRRLNTQN
jgi:hypothetical protein